MIFVMEPPAQYNFPYKGPVIERVLPLKDARAMCRKYGGPVKQLAPYRRHEMAHCNGWPANHPQF